MNYIQEQNYVVQFNKVLDCYSQEIYSSSAVGLRLSVELLYRRMFGKLPWKHKVFLNEQNELYVIDFATITDEKFKLPQSHYIVSHKNHEPIDAEAFIRKANLQCVNTSTGGVFAIDNDIICEFDLANYMKDKPSFVAGIEIFSPIGGSIDAINSFLKTLSTSLVFTNFYYNLNKRYFKVVSKQLDSFKSTLFPIESVNTNITKNYNDNLPYEKIVNTLNSDKKELIILSGEPGTGKTTFIKTLIFDNALKDKDFFYIDPSIFESFTETTFMDFLTENKNSIIVMEDCEKLLMKRSQGNAIMNVILNMTDGLIGDVFKIKFLCTLNCNESDIDPALLRKGRLSLKYDFTKLSLEKTKQLLPSATKEMTLAEIYNYDIDNGCDNKQKYKIGFI